MYWWISFPQNSTKPGDRADAGVGNVTIVTCKMAILLHCAEHLLNMCCVWLPVGFVRLKLHVNGTLCQVKGNALQWGTK